MDTYTCLLAFTSHKSQVKLEYEIILLHFRFFHGAFFIYLLAFQSVENKKVAIPEILAKCIDPKIHSAVGETQITTKRKYPMWYCVII